MSELKQNIGYRSASNPLLIPNVGQDILGRLAVDIQVGRFFAVFCDGLKQRSQNLTRLLVWQRHDVVTDRARANVHVTELTRSDRSVISLGTQAAGLEAPGQVAQRTGIHQLS